MQNFTAGQANVMSVDMMGKADAEPIISGAVTLHLQAKSGDNALKWYKASDGSWSDEEQVSGTAEHQANGRWSGTIAAGAWIAGIRYDLSGKESGGLNIPYSEEVSEVQLTANLTIETEVQY